MATNFNEKVAVYIITVDLINHRNVIRTFWLGWGDWMIVVNWWIIVVRFALAYGIVSQWSK